MFRVILCTLMICSAAAAAGAQSKSEAAVAQAAEQLRLAMISGDKAQLGDLVLPQLSYGHSGGHVDDRTEFLDKLTTGKSDFVTIEITGQTITVVKDVAIVRHRLHAETNDKGVPGKADLLVMLVWQKERKEWKLLARQAVKAK